MIQVKSNIGWVDYCEVGVETDITDMNGVVLKTGDIVEILEGSYHRAGIEDCCVGVSMMIFDQCKKFITDDRFFASGWLKMDWKDDKYLIRKVSADRWDSDDKHHRIVGEE